MKFTDDQHSAIYTHDRTVIVVAGAGSGKTRVLVERYLALLEENPDWPLNALVAITFTHKAAQEMRDRVRQALQQRLIEASGVDADRWGTLLAAMDSARIDTIHALCATILRANAAEAGIDPRFSIIEPVDADILLQDVIDRVLGNLREGGTPDPTAKLFSHYDARNIRGVLVAFATEPLEDMPATPNAIMAHWEQQWQRNADYILRQARQTSLLTDALHWCKTTTFPAGDKLAALWDEAYDGLNILNNSGSTVDERIAVLYFLCKDVKLTVGGYKAWGSRDAVAEAKDGLRTLREWACNLLDIIGQPPGPADEAAAEMLPLWMTLVRRVQHSYATLKNAEDLMDFDDLERHTATLLTESPDVRARYLDAEFRHVLVDEFQDTNAQQWAIIQALTDPAHTPADEPARLFIVGDPKQSIYGFRGADVSVFERVRSNMRQQAAEVPLVQSFRTHRPLIEAFNDIFGQLLVQNPGSIVRDYEVEYGINMDAHRTDAPSTHAPVEIMLMDTHERTPDSSDYLRNKKGEPDRKINAEDARIWEAYEIATRLRHIVTDEKRPVFDREHGETRPIRYGDVAMLFQTMSSVALYEEALRSQGINFVTVAGRGYYSRQEVWDLLALLESLYNPYDDLSLATALRSPLFALSDEALFALRLRHGQDGKRVPLWDELIETTNAKQHNFVPPDELPVVINTGETLRALYALAGRITISELLNAATARTGYLATLAGLPDGARRLANVEKLLRKAADSRYVTLSRFTQYLSDMSEREVREGEADTDASDAVQLMTVHASKGLEFPMVVLPDASWTRNRSSTSMMLSHPGYGTVCMTYDKLGEKQKPFLYDQITEVRKRLNDAERKRLLYVAATRAQDYLLVSGQVSWNADIPAWKTKGWLDWLLTALGLDAETATFTHVAYPWGQARLTRPLRKLEAGSPTRIVDEEPPLWENDLIRDEQLLLGDSYTPPLTQRVPPHPDRFARNLTATQIGDLGSADKHAYYSDRFRRSVLQGTPARVATVIHSQDDKPTVSPRILGEIVHEALRWWRFPDKDNTMEAELLSYAWKHGVVQPDELRYAVNTARGWLRDMKYTSVYRWINSAERVYRELPFVYQTDKRVIHGVIDVLFQRPDGTWVIVDYKSSQVDGYIEYNEAAERQNMQLLMEHAERYHLQVGVYAAAVERYLASIGEALEPEQLDIYLHYLRYVQEVRVSHAQWTTALSKLENQIGRLIEDIET
ncbi:MAG: UvrD-helicase domain-containing protein [Chloroflexota bacterium]